MNSWYRWDGDNLWLRVKLHPKAKRDGFVGPSDEGYRIQVTAAPVEGRANASLHRFLADAFDVPLAQIALKKGLRSRTKLVVIRSPRRLPVPLPR
ncbi:DUF167 family protein [Thioalkalicoccus limnaeus]|uniref:UPF0235 protein ABC977_02495 n=1 Tax=Thioalkalicoccus limnaeus TaxID=120681 RepID=A0ABV4BAN1_9GAMM